MRGRRVRIMVGVIVAMLVLGTGTAMAAKIFYSATKGQRTFGFIYNTNKQKIVDVFWENLRCSDDRVSGGLSDAIKVKSDRTFKSEQSVTTNEGVEIEVLMKGTVAKDLSEINGKLKFSGDCEQKATYMVVPPAG